MDNTKLSKLISYILRHKPEDYGIVLDQSGWTDLNTLIKAISQRDAHYAQLTAADIEQAVSSSSKVRHETQDGKIRAVYGHSVEGRIAKTPARPPDVLYHGTVKANLDKIRSSGLRSMNRQYVHLSMDTKTAEEVARRHGKEVIVFAVDARGAAIAGYYFYPVNNGIWLSENIPPKFLTLMEGY